MKLYFKLLLSIPTAVSLYGANVPEIQIRADGTNTQVQWTSCGCSGKAIYELFWGNAPTGRWNHVSFLTNATSFTLPSTNQAAFYRVGWNEGSPVNGNWTFDFAYYPLYGPDTNCAVATGPMSLSFFDGLISGTYNFAQSQCATRPVYFLPLGAQNISTYGGYSRYNASKYTIVLSSSYPAPELRGSYYYGTNAAGRCVPILYGGMWVSGVAGYSQQGTFMATAR